MTSPQSQYRRIVQSANKSSPLKSNKVPGSSSPCCDFWDEGGYEVFGNNDLSIRPSHAIQAMASSIRPTCPSPSVQGIIHPAEPWHHPSVGTAASSIRRSRGFIHPSEPWNHPSVGAAASSIRRSRGSIHPSEPRLHPSV